MTETNTTPSTPLTIEISEDSAYIFLTANGGSVMRSEYLQDLADCIASGDVSEACEYIRDAVGVAFYILAKDRDGYYRNRPATAEEKQLCCEAIYFESETDFSDEATAESYLIWEAASNAENED